MSQAQTTAQPKLLAPCIHRTASIGRNVELGSGVVIHAFVVVEDDACIGAGSQLHSHVSVGRGTVIGRDCVLLPQSSVREECTLGDRVVIESGSTIGSDGFGFATNGGVHHKVPQVGCVVIEDDVHVGANATIDRATMGETRVRQGVRIQNLAQIGHNVEIGEAALVQFQAGIAGSSKIGASANIGIKAGVLGHSTVGDRATISDFSGAIKAVKAGEHIAGLPGAPVEVNDTIQAALQALPDLMKEVSELQRRLAALESADAAEPVPTPG